MRAKKYFVYAPVPLLTTRKSALAVPACVRVILPMGKYMEVLTPDKFPMATALVLVQLYLIPLFLSCC